MINQKLDTTFFRYHIKTKDGIINYDISLREFVMKMKRDLLLGVSFAGYEWINMENPELIIK